MDQYVTGAIIRELREKHGLTQAELAERLYVSDKTVSKWENCKGHPDISLIAPLAEVFGISIEELMSGRTVSNINVSANMLRSKFYICPVCGNIIHSMGEAVISCHGVTLQPAQPEPSDENHKIFIEGVEDEYFVQIEHAMTKDHYISFIAALTSDSIRIVKLYPEGAPEARFQTRGVRQFVYYCNRDGLFFINVNKHIDSRRRSYDDSAERRALEHAAKIILG